VFDNFLNCMKSYLSDFEMKDGWEKKIIYTAVL